MNTYVKKNKVDEWLKKNLLYNPSSSTVLNDIYLIYQSEVIKQGRVPFTKREFCYRIRQYFKFDLEIDKIRIINRRGMIIKGVFYNDGELNVQY